MNNKKRFLCILLSLVMVLSPYIPRKSLAQEQTSASISDDYAFDVETVRGFIDTNLALGNVDEGFYQVIAQAWQASPRLFAETVADLSAAQIDYLAKGIAYAAVKYELDMPAVNDELFTSDASLAIAKLIQTQTMRTQTADLNLLYDTPLITVDNIPADVEPMSQGTVTVSNIGYTSSELIVGATATVQFTLTRNASLGYSRTVWVEVYHFRSGINTLKASRSVTIPIGSSSVTATAYLTFDNAGETHTRIVVRDKMEGEEISNGITSSPSAVYGKWKIRVSLPVNRLYTGMLYLYNYQGILQTSDICLGLAAKNPPATVENGNTPTGVYDGIIGYKQADTEMYGEFEVIELTGVSGQIVDSCAHRSGFLIHGGRVNYSKPDETYYPLYPTGGCVRTKDVFQKVLVAQIRDLISNYHLPLGVVIIEEYED